MPTPRTSRKHLSPRFAAASLLASAVALPVAAAPALGAHTHGNATLRVTIEGDRLEISLESPLDDLVGFEHAPRTDQQRAAVRAMASRLRDTATILAPAAAARCSIEAVQLASPALTPELLGEPASAAASSKSAGDHADLDAAYKWRCAAPAQLVSLDVGLMQAFPRLRKLRVEIVGPKGQSAITLTAGKRVVRF